MYIWFSGQTRWNPGPNSKVCAAHFEPAAFVSDDHGNVKKLQNAVPTLFNPSVAAAAGAVDVKPKKQPTPKDKSVGDPIQSQIKHKLQHVPKFSPIEAKIPVEVFLSIIEHEAIQSGLQKDCQLISLALEHLDMSSMEKTFETKAHLVHLKAETSWHCFKAFMIEEYSQERTLTIHDKAGTVTYIFQVFTFSKSSMFWMSEWGDILRTYWKG